MPDHSFQLITTLLAGLLSGLVTALALVVTRRGERKNYRLQQVETILLNVMRGAEEVKQYVETHWDEGFEVLVGLKSYSQLMLDLAALIGNASHHEKQFESFLRPVRLELIKRRNERYAQIYAAEPVDPSTVVRASAADQLLFGLLQGCDQRLKGSGPFDTHFYLDRAGLGAAAPAGGGQNN